jgi:hypothetical protein
LAIAAFALSDFGFAFLTIVDQLPQTLPTLPADVRTQSCASGPTSRQRRKAGQWSCWSSQKKRVFALANSF